MGQARGKCFNCLKTYVSVDFAERFNASAPMNYKMLESLLMIFDRCTFKVNVDEQPGKSCCHDKATSNPFFGTLRCASSVGQLCTCGIWDLLNTHKIGGLQMG
jgi:hypothetical protein